MFAMVTSYFVMIHCLTFKTMILNQEVDKTLPNRMVVNVSAETV